MTVFLEFYTLIFVQFGVLFISSLAFHLMLRLDTNNHALMHWRNGAFISAFGALTLSLFNYLPAELAGIVGVSALVLGYIYFWYGTANLVSSTKRSSKLLYGLSLAFLFTTSLTILCERYEVGYGIRVILMSIFLTVLPFLSIRELLVAKNKVFTVGSKLLVIGFAVVFLVSLLRLIITVQDLETKPKSIDLIAFYVYTISYIILVLGIILIIQERLQRKLNDIAACIAHEVNNPLNIIATYSEALLHFPQNKNKVDEKLTVILKSTERIAHVVRTIDNLSVDHVESRKVMLRLINCIEDSCELLKGKLEKNTIKVITHFQAPGLIYGNDMEIVQVISNLMVNAIDAVKNSKDKWIKINIVDCNTHLELAIEDSGVGITYEDRTKVFNPSFTTKKQRGGKGLGLAITQQILSEHNATIDLDRESKHTRFVIKFQKQSQLNNTHNN